MPAYQVNVIQRSTNEVIDSVGPVASWSQADRIESGMYINMNHKEYTTEIVEVKNTGTDYS